MTSLSKLIKPDEDVDSLDHIESLTKDTNPPVTTAPPTTQPSTSSNLDSKDYLGLLDITHLLEYQAHSQLATNGANQLPPPPPVPASSILRGGHVDALIVLATSANSTVIAPPPPSSSTSSTSPRKASHHHHQHHHNNAYSSHTLNSSSSPAYLSASLSHFNNSSTYHQRNKKNSFLFQEAFLTTYRTIIEPIQLIHKLIHRYRLFANKNPPASVVDSGGSSSLDEKLDAVSDEKFDFDRLNASNSRRKMAFSATRNSLTLLIRVLDGLE